MIPVSAPLSWSKAPSPINNLAASPAPGEGCRLWTVTGNTEEQVSRLHLSLSPAEGPRRALSHSGPRLPPRQRGVRTPDWGGFQGGSWRRSPPTLPAMCTWTHLDGKCDVRVGAEAPAPVAGAVVEAAACEDSHGVGRAGQGHAPGAPSVLPGTALGLQAGQANGPPWGRSPPLGPWVGGQLCRHGTQAATPRPQARPRGTHLR